MPTNPQSPIAALRECEALLAKATPGEWRWSENGNIMAPGAKDVDEIAAVYTEREDDEAPNNAAAIIATVNTLRAHLPRILAALELAERVAGAPTGFVIAQAGPDWVHPQKAAVVQMEAPERIKGQRVALVPITDDASSGDGA